MWYGDSKGLNKMWYSLIQKSVAVLLKRKQCKRNTQEENYGYNLIYNI